MSCVFCEDQRYWVCGPGADCDEVIVFQESGPDCKDYTHFVDQEIHAGNHNAWCLRGQCAAVLVPVGEEPAGNGWFDAGFISNMAAGTYEIWTKTGGQNGCNILVKPK